MYKENQITMGPFPGIEDICTVNLEYAKSRFLVVPFAQTLYSLSALIFLAFAVAGSKAAHMIGPTIQNSCIPPKTFWKYIQYTFE
jgi:hypothetical protein